mgnify:CR=1 FL=1
MNEKRTLTQADINAIVDALKNGDFAKQLVTDFARIVGVRIQEEDIIDSDAACRLLGNISHATLKKYAEICPEIRPAGKYSRKRLLEFRTLRQQGAFRKNKVYPVC